MPPGFKGDPYGVIHRPLPDWPVVLLLASPERYLPATRPIEGLAEDPGDGTWSGEFTAMDHHITADLVGIHRPPIEYVGKVVVTSTDRSDVKAVTPPIVGAQYFH